MRSKIAGHPGAVLVFPEGTTQAYGPPMAARMRHGAIEAAFESGKLVQPVRACARQRCPLRVPRLTRAALPRQCALYYSARCGYGEGAESNALRQTAMLAAGPCVAAVQLCAPLAPRDFATGEEMAAAAQRAIAACAAPL